MRVVEKKRLNFVSKTALWLLSFLLVAAGTPVWSGYISLIAAAVGFAIFWRFLLCFPRPAMRFFQAALWFTLVQLCQLSWFISHPYHYIYSVWFSLALLMGLQWGLLGLAVYPALFKSLSRLAAIASLWVLLEWSRLWLLSGFPFNPVGLALSGALYPLQFAAIGGVYGLSFWVIGTNLLALRAWIYPSKRGWALFISALLLPYIFGWLHVEYHQRQAADSTDRLSLLLIQPNFPSEESLVFADSASARGYVLGEWRALIRLLADQTRQATDLIALPEYLVPYGTSYAIYPLSEVSSLFRPFFSDAAWSFPPFQPPYAERIQLEEEGPARWFVSNAFIAQTLANLMDSHLVIGLEDSGGTGGSKRRISYSAALHFSPNGDAVEGYAKQILVPMGEYIPFEWCRSLAARYGIYGSFTAGQEACVFPHPRPFSVCICYEEIYGHLMRQGRVKGAEFLLNLTNDGWYPTLVWHHFFHARLRTVENGIPLARACNTGITAACDSLGRIIAFLEPPDPQSDPAALRVELPAYHYATLYTFWGDGFVLCASLFFILTRLSAFFCKL